MLVSPWDVIPYCFFEIKNIFCLILCVWWLSWYILASAFFCYTPALQIKTHPSKCKRDVKKHSEATPLRKKKGQDAPEWELAEEWVFFTNIIHGRMLTPLSVSVKNKAISWWMRGYGRNKEGDCQDSLIFKRVKKSTTSVSQSHLALTMRDWAGERHLIAGHISSVGGCYYSISLNKLLVI